MGLTFGILRSRTSQDCYDEIMTSRRAKGAAQHLSSQKWGSGHRLQLWLAARRG